jgi:hypothetical protein
MVLIDDSGLPLGVRLESASPGEATLAQVRVPRTRCRPQQKAMCIIADCGYDAHPLRERFKKRGIELIVLYRKNNLQRRYEYGRKLRRYKLEGSRTGNWK